QLPAAAPLAYFSCIRRRGLTERQHSIHDQMEITRLQQVANSGQLCMIRFNDKKRLLHAVVSSCLAICGDGDHPSARLQYGPGAQQSVAADRVKYDIPVPEVVFKAHCSVVNDAGELMSRYGVAP